MELKDCQVFTPPETVNYMLDLVGYQEDVFGKTLIDSSCGTGNFLVEVVRRFLIDAVKQNISSSKTKKALEKCVFGCDLDPICIDICIEKLNKVAFEFGYSGINWSIYKCDGLYYNESFKFDYVVGNPPYIAYLDLDEDIRKKTKENFRSCSKGKFDYSYAFIEKGLSLLKSTGKMAMITPANMFKTKFAENLRNIIKPQLTHIIDCSAKKIFDKVMTTSAITIYDGDCQSQSLIYREISKFGENNDRIINKDLLVGKWNFTDYVYEGTNRFGDFFRVSNCVATLANDIFIHDEDENGELDIGIEINILRVAKSPKSEQYGVRQKIIFPYSYQNGDLRNYSEQEMYELFPRAMAYLESRKKDLESRALDKHAKWYEFGRSQALKNLNQMKLLMSTIITKKVIVYELDVDTIPYSGIFITPKSIASLEDAKRILQSPRFFRYLLSKGVRESGDSIRISSTDIEEYTY